MHVTRNGLSTENSTPELNSQRQEPQQTDDASSKEENDFKTETTPRVNSQRQQTYNNSSKKVHKIELIVVSGKEVIEIVT
ncbi:39691_t:CDS:2, partial [Gigaspora margarita]